jgi:hypothetical protein
MSAHLRQVRNLNHLDRDTGYRFSGDVDPVLEWLRTDITDSGWSAGYLAERSGLCAMTVYNIMNGKTKRPQNITVDLLITALGWERPPRKIWRGRNAG